MKNILYVMSFLVLFIALLPSCNKNNEDEVNDYLPLKVGAKYKYSYSAYCENLETKGECTWKIISKSVGTPLVYLAEQSFTGYNIVRSYFWNGNQTIENKDSTHIENQISTLIFEYLKDGRVAFHISLPLWDDEVVTFERFKEGCSMYESRVVCLTSVGITRLFTQYGGNHGSTAGYSYILIEGPTN